MKNAKGKKVVKKMSKVQQASKLIAEIDKKFGKLIEVHQAIDNMKERLSLGAVFCAFDGNEDLLDIASCGHRTITKGLCEDLRDKLKEERNSFLDNLLS